MAQCYFAIVIVFQLVVFLLSTTPAWAEEEPSAESLIGLWEAHRDFGPQVRGELTIREHADTLSASISGFDVPVRVNDNHVQFSVPDDRGEFRGYFSDDGDAIKGHWIQPVTKSNFVRYASPVELIRIADNRWRGEVVPKSDGLTFFLKLMRSDPGKIRGFVRNPEANFGRFFTIQDMRVKGERILFVGETPDDTTFVADYDTDNESMSVFFPWFGGTYDFYRVDSQVANAFYPRPLVAATYVYYPPARENDGWEVASLSDVGMAIAPIQSLVQTIIDTPIDSITSPEVHAVLIARHGKLVLEEYFHGYSRTVPHQTRSASKSVTSTMAGIAIHDGEPISLSSPVYETMFAGSLPDDIDPRKKQIALRHLLTMSSGLACNDSDPDSPGNEERMQNQNEQPDWTQYTLDLPMACAPGDSAWYCSASPNLAGAMLSKATGKWLPEFFAEHVARSLEIGHYHINLTPINEAYGGGGLCITARDFLKFGQLMLNRGDWGGRQLLSKEWARDAVSPLVEIRDEGYGYNWWVIDYPCGDGKVRAFYAGGNGGQYVIGIPDLDLAILFFGGNYSQRIMHQTKREYVPRFILKAFQ